MRRFSTFLLAISLLSIVTGCGRDSKSSSAESSKAFESAPAETKRAWQAALEAGRTNDFESAKRLLYSLAGPELNPQQQQALNDALASLDEKFSAALEKGDPGAQRALEALRKDPPNRTR